MSLEYAAAQAVEAYFDEDPEESPAQEELFSHDDFTEAGKIILQNRIPKRVQFVATVAVKREGGKPCVIEVSAGRARSEFVEELIQLGLESQYFKDRLRSVVGQPSGQLDSLKNEIERAE